MPQFKLIINTDKWPTLAERRENVARLLRQAATRIENGHEHGGFHFSPTDTNTGGFAFTDRELKG